MYQEKNLLHKRQKEYESGQLRTIALDVTTRCNMNCPHCYAETFKNSTAIDINELKPALEEAYQLGVHHYVLQGGEAILDHERLENIINSIHPDETYINVVSNGLEMTTDKIEWLKSLKVDKIAFSIDSGIPEEHDANRAPGSFHKVLEAVDNVKAAGLLSSISTVFTRNSLNSEGFQKTLMIARQKNIRVDIQIAMPVGKWDGKKDILITPEESTQIKKMQLGYPVLANGQRMVNRDVFNFGGEDHCPAGTEFMAITADGNFLPCNFCQFTLGNIREKSLTSMRNDLLKSSWFTGKRPKCLVGEDEDFIDRFIVPNVRQVKPLNAYHIFNL